MISTTFKLITEEEARVQDARTCKIKRGPRATTLCELPKGHAGPWHIGRSFSGRWFSWSLNPSETTAKLDS